MAYGNKERAWTYQEYVEKYEQLQAKVKRLKEGIRLHIILRDREQFTPPGVIKAIGKFTGKEYKAGHLIFYIKRDLEQELSGK